MEQTSRRQEQTLLYRQEAPKNNKTKVVLVVILVLAAAIAVAGVVWIFANDTAKAELNPQHFVQGVSVLGCDLSGQTMEQAQIAVEQRAQQMIADTAVTYQVGDQQYSISGQQAGMTIDTPTALASAFAYGKSGDEKQDQADARYAAENGITFPCTTAFDAAAIQTEVNAQIPPATETAGTVSLKKTADEAARTTGFEIIQSDAQPQPTYDTTQLANQILQAFETESAESVIAVEREGDTPQTAQYEEISSYQTKISSPQLDSAYNIWKASDQINGTEIAPGATWSMREALGGMEEQNGWKVANERFDKNTTPIAGGGLNHLASTIYAAALQAELGIDQRVPRDLVATYIEAGLDADIFSQGSDLKIKNETDAPVFLGIRCDAQNGTLDATVVAPQQEGQRKLNTQSEGGTAEQPQVTVNVSLTKTDAAGNVIEEKELYTDTYDGVAR